MKTYAVYFQEKKLENADLPWNQIQGVTLTVESCDELIYDEVETQLANAADYQLEAHGIEAVYRGSWDDNGCTRVAELVPNSMWGDIR